MSVTMEQPNAALVTPPMQFEQLQEVFMFGVKDAADKLGISMARLKKDCRILGIARWPSRKLCSLANLRQSVCADTEMTQAAQLAYLAKIDIETSTVMRYPDHDVNQELFDIRSSSYKARYYRKFKELGLRNMRAKQRTSMRSSGSTAALPDRTDDLVDYAYEDGSGGLVHGEGSFSLDQENTSHAAWALQQPPLSSYNNSDESSEGLSEAKDNANPDPYLCTSAPELSSAYANTLAWPQLQHAVHGNSMWYGAQGVADQRAGAWAQAQQGAVAPAHSADYMHVGASSGRDVGMGLLHMPTDMEHVPAGLTASYIQGAYGQAHQSPYSMPLPAQQHGPLASQPRPSAAIANTSALSGAKVMPFSLPQDGTAGSASIMQLTPAPQQHGTANFGQTATDAPQFDCPSRVHGAGGIAASSLACAQMHRMEQAGQGRLATTGSYESLSKGSKRNLAEVAQEHHQYGGSSRHSWSGALAATGGSHSSFAAQHGMTGSRSAVTSLSGNEACPQVYASEQGSAKSIGYHLGPAGTSYGYAQRYNRGNSYASRMRYELQGCDPDCQAFQLSKQTAGQQQLTPSVFWGHQSRSMPLDSAARWSAPGIGQLQMPVPKSSLGIDAVGQHMGVPPKSSLLATTAASQRVRAGKFGGSCSRTQNGGHCSTPGSSYYSDGLVDLSQALPASCSAPLAAPATQPPSLQYSVNGAGHNAIAATECLSRPGSCANSLSISTISEALPASHGNVTQSDAGVNCMVCLTTNMQHRMDPIPEQSHAHFGSHVNHSQHTLQQPSIQQQQMLTLPQAPTQTLPMQQQSSRLAAVPAGLPYWQPSEPSTYGARHSLPAGGTGQRQMQGCSPGGDQSDLAPACRQPPMQDMLVRHSSRDAMAAAWQSFQDHWQDQSAAGSMQTSQHPQRASCPGIGNPHATPADAWGQLDWLLGSTCLSGQQQRSVGLKTSSGLAALELVEAEGRFRTMDHHTFGNQGREENAMQPFLATYPAVSAASTHSLQRRASAGLPAMQGIAAAVQPVHHQPMQMPSVSAVQHGAYGMQQPQSQQQRDEEVAMQPADRRSALGNWPYSQHHSAASAFQASVQGLLHEEDRNMAAGTLRVVQHQVEAAVSNAGASISSGTWCSPAACYGQGNSMHARAAPITTGILQGPAHMNVNDGGSSNASGSVPGRSLQGRGGMVY